jgi:hypothetical protein
LATTDEWKKKDLGEIDESIKEALPMFLWTGWELDERCEFESLLDGWNDVNVVKYKPDHANSVQCFTVEQTIP